MGTSSLYYGPKKHALLPSDYAEENNATSQAGTPEEVSTQENPQEETENLEEKNPKTYPSWSGTKNSLTRSMGDRRRIRRAIKTYVLALGGHANATKQARTARKVTSNMLVLFAGGQEAIKHQLKEAGISVENKSVKEVCREIYTSLLLPGSTIEESIVNSALANAFDMFMEKEEVENMSWDNMNDDLIQELECLFIANTIVSKLLNDASIGMIKKARTTNEYLKAEKDIMDIVNDVVTFHAPAYLNNMTSASLSQLVHDLYDRCYQVLEE